MVLFGAVRTAAAVVDVQCMWCRVVAVRIKQQWPGATCVREVPVDAK